MTPEEITKLAEEYAVEVTKDMAKTLDEPSCLLNETKRATKEYITDFMQWLLRTHCIVSKEKVAEIKENIYLKDYEFLTERCIEDLTPERTDWHRILSLCDGMYYVLKQLLDETDK